MTVNPGLTANIVERNIVYISVKWHPAMNIKQVLPLPVGFYAVTHLFCLVYIISAKRFLNFILFTCNSSACIVAAVVEDVFLIG